MGSMAEFFARGQQIAQQRQAQDMSQKIQQTQLDKILNDRSIERQRTSPGYAQTLAEIMDPNTPTDSIGAKLARLAPVDWADTINNRQQNLQQKALADSRAQIEADRVKAEGDRVKMAADAEAGRNARNTADISAANQRNANTIAAENTRAANALDAKDNPKPKTLSAAQERSTMDTIRSKILETKLGVTAREFDSGKIDLPEDLRGIAPEQINQHLAEAAKRGLALVRSGMPIEDAIDEVSGALDYTPAKDSAFSKLKPASLTSGGAVPKKADAQAPDAIARQMIRDAVQSGQSVSGPALMKQTGLSREEIQRIFDEENK